MTKFKLFITYFAYLLSCLFPRNKRIWVFIGWHRTLNGEIFTDNTKYLYLYVKKNQPTIRPIWLAKSRTVAEELNSLGLTSYYEKSILGIWYALHAGVTVLDAYLQQYNFQFVGNSKIVQLLHGKGMKKGGYSKLPFKKNDFIFLPSQNVGELLSSIFKSDTPLYVTGYPRTDGILGCNYEKMVHVDKSDLSLVTSLNENKVPCILYSPTFRRGQTNVDINSILDLENLSKTLEDVDSHLFISLHPKYHQLDLSSKYEKIHILRQQDIISLYRYFSILITDYSSCFTDFLLLNRPIIFYPYDYEAYSENEGIIQDYVSITPGPKAKNPHELRELIKMTLHKDMYEAKRKEILNIYHDYVDSKSSERIVAILNESLKL